MAHCGQQETCGRQQCFHFLHPSFRYKQSTLSYCSAAQPTHTSLNSLVTTHTCTANLPMVMLTMAITDPAPALLNQRLYIDMQGHTHHVVSGYRLLYWSPGLQTGLDHSSCETVLTVAAVISFFIVRSVCFT